DDSRRTGKHAIQVVAGVIPQGQLRLVTRRILAAIQAACETGVLLGKSAELVDFRAIKEPADDKEAVMLVVGKLVVGEASGGHEGGAMKVAIACRTGLL